MGEGNRICRSCDSCAVGHASPLFLVSTACLVRPICVIRRRKGRGRFSNMEENQSFGAAGQRRRIVFPTTGTQGHREGEPSHPSMTRTKQIRTTPASRSRSIGIARLNTQECLSYRGKGTAPAARGVRRDSLHFSLGGVSHRTFRAGLPTLSRMARRSFMTS